MRAAFAPSLTLAASIAVVLTAAPEAQTTPRVNPNAATIADFQKRVDVYVAVHKKAEGTLPNLPKDANPKQLDTHQRSLAKLIQADRKAARPGDIFTPAMQQLVRDLLRPVFTGRGGLQIKDEIMDNENKAKVVLAVNARYPDEIPVSTVPPQVLMNLPKLPEEIEYRFVRTNMILFDPHAHIIPDWVPNAFK